MANAEDEIFEMGEKMFATLGLDAPLSKSLSILMFSPNEVSLQDLSAKTGYSLATTLNKIKLFETAGMVQRIKKPGTKKVFYYMEKDRKKLIQQKFRKIHICEMEFAEANIPSLLKKYQGKKISQKEKQMIAITEKFYAQSKKLGKCMEEFLRKIDDL